METPPDTKVEITPPMDDIQRYLHLEAARRFKEDELNVRRQVEEQARQWLDAKCEYQREYARLSRLTKCIAQRVAIDAMRSSDAEKRQQALADIAQMRAKISSDQRPTQVDAKVLEHCQAELERRHSKPREQLSRQQRNFAENHNVLRSLRTSVEALENILEMAMVQAMNQQVQQLLPPPERQQNAPAPSS
ncbi:hypothetical protein KR009_001304 [Drosophila setifemur]|nr:hypothetical protein KR009_001304 [Drosophila setifemur]